MLAARALSCNALSVGTAATQRGRSPQLPTMKRSSNSAVVVGSTVAAFNVGGGGIAIVDHSLVTSVACAGAAARMEAAAMAAKGDHLEIAGMRSLPSA